MKPDILDDGIPAPGVPLTPEQDETNKRIQEEELRERMRRIGGKLGPKLLKRTRRRQRQLHRQLRRARWNALVEERWQIVQEYEQCKAALALAETEEEKRAVAAEGRAVAEAGRIIQEQIARWQPLADEYAEIAARLARHQDALKAEREDEENRRAFVKEADVWEEQIRSVFYQSPRLHHLWSDSDGRSHCDVPEIERRFILADRIMYKIATSRQGILQKLIGGRWSSALPYGVDIKALLSEETLENLSAACNRVVTVERSKKGTNFYYVISRLDSPDGIPERVLYARVLDWYPTELHAKTPWFAGMSANRKIETFAFEDFPHMLIGGATKGGKSNFINQMIATLVSMNSPAELRFVLVDLKGGVEFTHWSELKHNLRPIVKRAQDVTEALTQVRTMLDKRLALFESRKTKTLAVYNASAGPGERLARIIVVIDEMATLMEDDDIKVQVDKMLNTIASQGRAVGIHLVICTQRPSADVVMGWMKTNASLLISAKMPHFNSSLIILGTDTAAKLPSIPGRMVFSRGRDEVICQTPYITDDEIAEAVAISQGYDDPPDEEAAAAAPPPKTRFDDADVIALALARLGGKLSPTRMIELIPDKSITEHMLRKIISRITEDGVGAELVHDGRRYRLGKLGKSFILRAIEEDPGDNGYRADSPIAPDAPIDEDEQDEENEYA